MHHRPSSPRPSSSTTAPGRTRGRRRAPTSSTSRLPAPSSGLLSLLAVIATSSSAHASPTPPVFLCPGLETDECTGAQTAPPLARRSSQSRTKRDRTIPDKYEEGEDGVWRKVDYSLHGGPSCTTSTESYVDDETQLSTSTTLTSDGMSESSTHLLDTLPNGWKPTKSQSSSRTTLILALSIALAILICVFMISCIFWRKGNRRKVRKADMEMKLRRRRRDGHDSEEELSLAARQEAEVKQRTITRLVSRWKANARSSARYRRSRKTLRAMHSSAVSVHAPTSDDEEPAPSRSPSPSRASTSSNTSRSHSESSVEEARTTALDLYPSSPPSPPPPPLSLPDVQALPPAYRRRTPPPSISTASDDALDIGPSDTKSPVFSQDHASGRPRPNPSLSDPESSEYGRSPHAAHVATDDKTLLARLANQASAPPVREQGAGASSSNAPVWAEAPAWVDESLEDVIEASGGRGSPDSYRAAAGSSTAFPDPPTKGQMAALLDSQAAYADSQAYDYNMFHDAEPELGPSAPPFDYGHAFGSAPSAPPVLRSAPPAMPSAPPLFEDDSAHGGERGLIGGEGSQIGEEARLPSLGGHPTGEEGQPSGEEARSVAGEETLLRPSAPRVGDDETFLDRQAEGNSPVPPGEDLEYAEEDLGYEEEEQRLAESGRGDKGLAVSPSLGEGVMGAGQDHDREGGVAENLTGQHREGQHQEGHGRRHQARSTSSHDG
ncbi:hypothetical protein BD626DRAFT_486789 [Schizophyllum amplum]|uniref:Uncharacterized protein n=1 Tax=Schizophyllum amplum TaxID=97359 RepID=A0A550CMU3_9AGAR|nr:hypothetical protein BD626DRAFT_486789 [Auriculariopsis ampla]